MTAEVIAWLRSPEGEEWSRERDRWQGSSAAPRMYQRDPGDPAEDPAGRPHPRLGEIAATEECA